MNQLLDQINQIRAQLAADLETAQLSRDEFQLKYLGKKGAFNQVAAVLKKLPAEEKKAAGQKLNDLREQINHALDSYQPKTAVAPGLSETAAAAAQIDLTLPPQSDLPVGHLHPITQAIERITEIFTQIGFQRVRYPEVDSDYYVFEALNMPPTHPARDEWETFFVHNPAAPDRQDVVMTTHTSNGQIHEMQRLGQPPIRMINISRCYRRQQDATHTQMFHQFEGLVVDKGINITHLKGVLDYFAETFYGHGVKSRIRPFHFQFTEPSFEIDFSCHICNGSGFVTDQQTGEQAKCKFCKSGWHEVGGAGMVHPNVLEGQGIDSSIYTGFAFGWGVERTYTLQPNLNIDDIRNFYSGNLAFLKQF